MKFPDVITTIGDKYHPAMKITDQAEADEYFAACVEHAMRTFGSSQEEAEKNERSNLAFFAVHCSGETRERVERLFSCGRYMFRKPVDGNPAMARVR
jgi:hypothetical protein